MPNLIWSIDWTEYKAGRKKFFILVLLDEAARFFLGWSLTERRPSAADVCSLVNEILGRYEGCPLFIKSDRAKVFLSNEWESLLRGRGIIPHRVRPRSPWEQGTIERAIREVKAWLRAGRPRGGADTGACVDEGMLMLNFLKPRAVLGGWTPARAYWRGAVSRGKESRVAVAA